MTLMTSATSALAERRLAGASPARALTGPLLIAARDDDSARGALRIAELVARRDSVNAHVLSLVQPLPFTASLLTNVDAAALREGQQRKQLARVLGGRRAPGNEDGARAGPRGAGPLRTAPQSGARRGGKVWSVHCPVLVVVPTTPATRASRRAREKAAASTMRRTS